MYPGYPGSYRQMEDNVYFLPDENGTVLLKLCKTAEGHPYYLKVEPGPEEKGADSGEFVKATKYKLPSRSCFRVFSLPGLPPLDLSCVTRIKRNEIVFGATTKRFKFDFSLLVEDKKDLFVQPNEYNDSSGMFSHFFEVDEKDIESGNNFHTFKASPCHVCSKAFGMEFDSLNGCQIVLNESDGWMEKLSVQEKELFAFERYFDATQNAYFLVSKPILNYSELLSEKSESILKNFTVISLLKVKKSPSSSSFPYTFKKKFVGTDLILFPFISFVAGLAAVVGKFIYAKIAHLTQSSGYGKTRLCFELLKYYKRGIYCVYRKGNDFGYPKTTPWTKALVDAFANSQSDDESVLICLKFIKWAVVNFSVLRNEHFSAFVGKTTLKASFVVESRDTSIRDMLVKDIESAVGHKYFVIILDECQEFIMKPKLDSRDENTLQAQGNLITLYRAFRRAMNLIRESKVVVICLGTKSSLGDFILAGKGKPSDRLALPKEDETFDVPVYLFTHSCNSMLNRPFYVTYKNTCTTKLIEGCEVPRSNVLRSIALRCGRPLWRQYGRFIDAFTVADTKLKGDDFLKEVAALIMRTGSSIVPQDPFAHQLVLSGLATLMHVDVDGSRCYVEYVPEPLLSNCARIMLTNMGFFRKSLAEYIKRLQAGVFHETGAAGEQVGRIALLRALDLVVLIPRRRKTTSVTDSSFKAIPNSDLTGSENPEVATEFVNRLALIKQNAPLNSQASVESPELKPASVRGPVDEDPAQASVDEAESEVIESVQEGTNEPASLSQSEPAQASVDETEPEVIQAPETTPVEAVDGKEPVTSVDTEFISFWNPTMPIATVQQFLLMLSDGSIDNQLDKLGVSDDVLDGLVCFSQFVNMENPLLINQVYLMQAFARGCALSLPDRAPGADAIIPVLRKDNRMSCIAVQFKNFDVKTFPCGSAKVSSKLTHDYLSFLDWSAIGDFQAVDVDDFVRLVIQFGSEDNDSPVKFAFTKIPASNQYALWIRGLKALEHLFFADKEVLSHLNTILSGRRDFYGNLDYSRFPLPTYLQTTEEGARFLGRLARPLANYSNLIPYDDQMRNDSNVPEKSILDKSINLMQLPKACLDTFQSCKISPTANQNPDDSDTDLSTYDDSDDSSREEDETSAQRLSHEEQNILSQVVGNVENESGYKTRLSAYQSRLASFKSEIAPHVHTIEEKFKTIKRPYREASEKIAEETELAFRSPKPSTAAQEPRPRPTTRQAAKNAAKQLEKE